METSTQTPTWTTGDRLRKAREWSNIESQAMAEILGVSRNTISNYEHDRTEPTLSALRRWSEVTGVPVDWLLDLQGDAESRSRCFLGDIRGVPEYMQPSLFAMAA